MPRRRDRRKNADDARHHAGPFWFFFVIPGFGRSRIPALYHLCQLIGKRCADRLTLFGQRRRLAAKGFANRNDLAEFRVVIVRLLAGKEISNWTCEWFPAELMTNPTERLAFGAVKVSRENVVEKPLNQFRCADAFEQFQHPRGVGAVAPHGTLPTIPAADDFPGEAAAGFERGGFFARERPAFRARVWPTPCPSRAQMPK